MDNKIKYDQYFTALWASELLFDEHFSHLTANDLVWEPTCGHGSFLAAIPEHIPAIGSNIDPELSAQANVSTGRITMTGDCRVITLPSTITAVIGNPPFSLRIFEGLLKRCEELLVIGNKMGFILPAYFFQTSTTLKRLNRKWTIHQQMLPRDLFYRLEKPLVFASFIRENFPKLFGFFLYDQVESLRSLTDEVYQRLSNEITGTRNTWKNTITVALNKLGGTATLPVKR